MPGYPPFETAHHDVNEEQSRIIYDFLVSEIRTSKHGDRFALRDFTLEPTHGYPSPLNVSQAYYEPVPTTDEHRLKLAYTAAELVMPLTNFDALVEGMQAVYKHEKVKRHMGSGGVLKFVDSHHTYVNQVMQELASWAALHDMGIEAPEQKQATIVSRITGLFTLELLEHVYDAEGWQHHGGAIFEDILLPFGGALQTLPNSSSGNRLMQSVENALPLRRGILQETKSAYRTRVLESGLVVFEGSSGTENWDDMAKKLRVIGMVTKKTADLSTHPTDAEDNQKVLLAPVFMECNPFTGNAKNPIEPRPTPFSFLIPRFVKRHEDFHQTMVDIASAGQIYKTSGTLPFVYEGHEEMYSTPDELYSYRVKT